MVEKVRPAVTAWKEPIVEKIANDIKNAKTVAVVNLVDLPSKQLQDIRSKVKKNMKIRVTRKRLLRRALEKSGAKGSEKLIEHLKGMSALLCSDLDSFELFKILKVNMSDSPAKTGQVAPFDIIIPAGPTQFSPGPILSELGEAGLKAAIESGKVVIKESAVVVKEGEEVSEKVASVLSKFEIKPMKIGLNLLVALENNELMLRETLDIDEEVYNKKLQLAHSEAFKLAISQSIINKETIEILLLQATNDAEALASSQGILTEKNVKELITKTEKSAIELKKNIKLKEVNK